MATTIQKLGPGEFTLGEIGTEVDIACQLTACTLEPSVNQEDNAKVLCGTVVPGARDYTWALKATLFQDWRAEGVGAFSVENRGQQVKFVFTPDADSGVTVTGTVIIDPLPLGGEVDVRATAEWELAVVGDPTFVWAT